MFLIALAPSFALIGQVITLNYNQVPPLVVNAGSDVTLASGHSALLGGTPSAKDGYGSYLYLWSPAAGLDDPTKANPSANPKVSTTYILTVTDAKNCSVQDEVTVTVQTSGLDEISESIDFKVYPNPAGDKMHIGIVGASGQLILKIASSTGIVVHQVNQEVDKDFYEELDTRLYPKGYYFVIANFNGKVITRPIIIL